jgi:nickel superoxide dismutase
LLLKFYKSLVYSTGMQLFKTAYAHCDIPCGIYDPHGAVLAAKTVLVMDQKIKGLEKGEDEESKLNYKNNLTRMIMVKEEHAQICKKELLILWTDYFKPEHFKAHPDLSDKILSACKLCSYNKQHIEEEKAEELVKAVDEIAEIFASTKSK